MPQSDRSHKRWEVIILWGFAVIWSALSMPLAYVQIPKALARGETLVACIIGVMLVVAVGLLIGAIRTTRDARRFGDVALQLDPFPGSIGGLRRHHGAARGVSAGAAVCRHAGLSAPQHPPHHRR